MHFEFRVPISCLCDAQDGRTASTMQIGQFASALRRRSATHPLAHGAFRDLPAGCSASSATTLPKGPARAFGLLAHMTLGQCVFALLLVRLSWRYANPPPPPETTPFGRLLEIAAKRSHFTLYALAAGRAVARRDRAAQARQRVADLRPLAIRVAMAGRSQTGAQHSALHGTLADALLILAGVHAGAALVHHWIWRDRTLARMLPGRDRRRNAAAGAAARPASS